MATLNWSGAWFVVSGLLAVQILTVALGRSLRTFSRSRLEVICGRRGRAGLVEVIEAQDESTERAADTLAVVAEVFVACLLATILPVAPVWQAVVLGGLTAIFVHFLASLLGRVWAETFLTHCWIFARPVRLLAWPLTTVAAGSERLVNHSMGINDAVPRPASLEVEIIPDTDYSEKHDPLVPNSTRAILEHVVGLTLKDVSELMKPRWTMTMLPSTATAQQAVEKFCETGLSRIPLYGENRDDIVGILSVKDLVAVIIDPLIPNESIIPRKMVSPAFFVPESKNASDLLTEMRTQGTSIAIVLDEYGGVAGLITVEDLLAQLLGPSETDAGPITRDGKIKQLGEARYEVDATVPVGQVNHRLRLHLPTDGKYQTVGGYAFNELGRLPNPGEMFVADGVQFTILEVVERSIRRVLLELS